MERLIYGWGDTDVPEYGDDDSSDEEEEGAMEEDSDMMLEDVQIPIAVEDSWGTSQHEEDKWLHEKAESLIVAEEALLDSH